MSTEAIPDGARALEKLSVQIRSLTAKLVSLDGWERWGGGGAEAMAQYGDALAEQLAAKKALSELLARLRTDDPRAVDYWAEAHIRLLRRFLEGADDSTGRFVAAGEIAAWEGVRAGTGPLVDENTVYVQFDRALHAELFGV